MKDKLIQIIAELLLRQSQLKMEIKTRQTINSLTDEKLNEILDQIEELEAIINKLKKGL